MTDTPPPRLPPARLTGGGDDLQRGRARRRAGGGVVGRVVDLLLPLSLVLALSPVPVIAVVLLLLAHGAHRSSVAFLAGWGGGIAGVTVLSALLLESAEGQTSHARHRRPA